MPLVSGLQSDLRPLALVPGELECQAMGMHIRHEMHGNEEATSKNTQAHRRMIAFSLPQKSLMGGVVHRMMSCVPAISSNAPHSPL